MSLLQIVGNQAVNVSTLLEHCTVSRQHPLVRQVASRVFFAIASEALALIALAYHSVAIVIKALPATIHLFHHAVPDHYSWKQVYLDHVGCLGECLMCAIRVPVQLTSSVDRIAKEFKQLAKGILGPSVSLNDKTLWQTLGIYRYRVLTGTLLLSAVLILWKRSIAIEPQQKSVPRQKKEMLDGVPQEPEVLWNCAEEHFVVPDELKHLQLKETNCLENMVKRMRYISTIETFFNFCTTEEAVSLLDEVDLLWKKTGCLLIDEQRS